MSAEERRAAQDKVIALLERVRGMPCSVLVPFATREMLPILVSVTKWPTCLPGDRDQLVERAGELDNQDFGPRPGRARYPDIWKFMAWAEKRAYDIESQPAPHIAGAR